MILTSFIKHSDIYTHYVRARDDDDDDDDEGPDYYARTFLPILD